MELTIKNKVYEFKFNMKFMREVNKRYSKEVDKGIKKNIGLNYIVAGIIDRDIESLVDVLYTSCVTDPRITKAQIDEYIDDECDDIEALFEEVKAGFLKANATRSATMIMLKALEQQNNQMN